MTQGLQPQSLARHLVPCPHPHLERALVPPPRSTPPSSSSPTSSPSTAMGASAASARTPGSVAAAGLEATPSLAPLTSCATAAMLQTVMSGLAGVREPRMVRERFEEELRALVHATSVSFRQGEDESHRPNVVSFDLPGSPVEERPRLEAVFDPSRPVDDRSRRMLAAGAQVAGLLLEIERANGRWPLASARSRSDGAAPMIGSSRAIRLVRDRIERVASTDFTVLIEGGSGPQPHPDFIEVFSDAAVDYSHRAVAGAGEDASEIARRYHRRTISSCCRPRGVLGESVNTGRRVRSNPALDSRGVF